MSSANPSIVVIACPHCGTRYQVPHGTLGSAGREVQCAQCGKSWHATAEAPPTEAAAPDVIFNPADEAALDAAFESAAAGEAPPAASTAPADPDYERTLAEIRAAIAPKPKPRPANDLDAATLSQSRRAFDKRQRQINGGLPIARLRRTARLAAFVALLSVLILAFALRTDLVTWFPQLAGLYSAIGLPVNVVGLDFTDAKTLTSFRNGKTVMLVTAKIRSVSSHPVAVPPVLISLLDAGGGPVYEWTVSPKANEMDPGEVLDLSSEINAPPDSAVSVRLSFANPGSISAPFARKGS